MEQVALYFSNIAHGIFRNGHFILTGRYFWSSGDSVLWWQLFHSFYYNS